MIKDPRKTNAKTRAAALKAAQKKHLGERKPKKKKSVRPVDTAWVQRLVAERYEEQQNFVAKLGMDAGAFSLLIHGKRDLKPEEAGQIAVLLGQDVMEVFARFGLKVPSGGIRRVPVIGIVHSDGQVRRGSGALQKMKLTAECPVAMPAGSEALLWSIHGFAEEWIAFYTPPAKGRESVNPDARGRLCLASTGQHEYIGVLTAAAQKGMYRLNKFGIQAEMSSDYLELKWAVPISWMRCGHDSNDFRDN